MTEQELDQRLREDEAHDREKQRCAAYAAAGGSWQNLTMRDFFAATALQGMLAAAWSELLRDAHSMTAEEVTDGNETFVKVAYKFADAMLRTRKA